MRVSVIIPTHNRHDILKKCLESLVNGSVVPDEVVVVDDGSTPPVTHAFLSDGLGLLKLKLLHNDHSKGAAFARNRGAEIASGDILIFFDDDVLPDYNCVRYHKKIHERFSSPSYGIMGRLYFDPELNRTPVMHYLEEYGIFKAISKGEDQERQTTGLISANFSMKRSFAKQQPLFFDEKFPYSQTEDTEFGVRMISNGWNLHYHIAPSARHHSDITIEIAMQKFWEGGVSKAYWCTKSPNSTFFVDYLEECFIQKEQENKFQLMCDQYKKKLGKEFFNSDIAHVSQIEFDMFHTWMKHVFEWKKNIGIIDGWMRICPSFSAMTEDLRLAFCDNPKTKVANLARAYQRDQAFLPVALCYADSLAEANRLQEAIDVLKPFSKILSSQLRIMNLQNRLGNKDSSAAIAQKIYDSTNDLTKTAKLIQDKAATHLIGLMKNNQVDLIPWAQRTWLKLNRNNSVKDKPLVDILFEYLSKQRCKLPPESYKIRNIHHKLQSLKKIGKQISSLVLNVNGLDTGEVDPTPPKELKKINHKGIVTWYAVQKNFGFVLPDGQNRLHFTHGSYICEPGINTLKKGDRVSFDPHETCLGVEARNVYTIR